MTESNMQKTQIPYTPTTEEVRNGYTRDRGLTNAEHDAEFDRWLAEAKAEAWDEGQLSMKPVLSVWPKQHHMPANPYRQGETE